MSLKNTFARHALYGSLLAAVATPVSLANAQFKVEYDDGRTVSSQPAKAKEGTRTFIFKSDDGDHNYEVKLVDGAVEFATIDGKRIVKDRIRTKEDRVIFLDQDGKTLYEFKVPAMTKSVWTPKGDDQKQFVIETNIERPKVMLGINLSEPGEAMRKQLKLGEDQQVILVEKVIEGLPAQRAGLEDFDVILSIDGSDQASGETLSKVLREKEPGDELKLYILRGGEKKKVTVTLAEYSAKKLGVTPPAAPMAPRTGLASPKPNPALPKLNQEQDKLFGFRMKLGPEMHEQIMSALKKSGLSEEELAKVQEQLHQHLGELGRFFEDEIAEFAWHEDDAHKHEEHEHADHAEREAHERLRAEANEKREYAQLAREKARQAIREAERQVMELRDGRLIVRNADRMEDELGRLEGRLDSLEARLEGQMDRLETQLDRMADMFERLLDRLEQGNE